MELIILGLKRKSDGQLYIYDVEQGKENIPISVGETKKIEILSPFPFSNYSSLDDEKIDFDKYEKCYLKVNGDLKSNEYHSMRSSGIVYYRFYNRNVTLIEEFYNIFQYSLQMLNSFGEQLGTHELTTWVIHNDTLNEAEYIAMKKIIYKAVTDKKTKQYPLDITLDKYTLNYIDCFREFEGIGREITFGKYGSISRDEEVYKKVNLSEENLIYLLGKNSFLDEILIKHQSFTSELYNKFIANTQLEIELLSYDYNNQIQCVLNKGLDSDEVYKRIFDYRMSQIDVSWQGYDSLSDLMNDDNFETSIEHHSPFDYYCCEDCDGYDIYERYTEEELQGYVVEVDSRVDYVNELLQGWEDLLTEDSFYLFDFVPNNILEKASEGEFIKELLKYRKEL